MMATSKPESRPSPNWHKSLSLLSFLQPKSEFPLNRSVPVHQNEPSSVFAAQINASRRGPGFLMRILYLEAGNSRNASSAMSTPPRRSFVRRAPTVHPSVLTFSPRGRRNAPADVARSAASAPRARRATVRVRAAERVGARAGLPMGSRAAIYQRQNLTKPGLDDGSRPPPSVETGCAGLQRAYDAPPASGVALLRVVRQ
mmetsp:Transcript_22794/g.70495  ORF Transcript_22794/g.70495 Transcript_22794/m.70495 type:complete len:200 (+) Transcript_22794:588-1187(+)